MPAIPVRIPAYNAINRIFAIPCAIPPVVYVETAIEAVISMFYSFLEPDVRELYTQVRGHSALCEVKGALKDIFEGVPGTNNPVTKTVFKISEIIDVGTFWLFIAALVNEGLFDWSSQLHRVAACAHTDQPNVGSGPYFFGGLEDNGTWDGMAYSADAGSKFAPVWESGSSCVVKPGKSWAVAASQSFHAVSGPPVGTSARLINLTTGQVYDSDTNTTGPDGLNRATHIWNKGKNTTSQTHIIAAQFAYFGPPLPLRECLGDHDGFGFVFVQP